MCSNSCSVSIVQYFMMSYNTSSTVIISAKQINKTALRDTVMCYAVGVLPGVECSDAVPGNQLSTRRPPRETLPDVTIIGYIDDSFNSAILLNVDLCGCGGEGPGCARTGDPQPAAAVGRVVLLHSGHLLITDIPLQPTLLHIFHGEVWSRFFFLRGYPPKKS